MEFDFGLRFQIDPNANLSEVIDRLAEVGCDDAVVGIGRPGRLAMEFSRAGASVEEAITSALAAVKRAIPSAELVESSHPSS